LTLFLLDILNNIGYISHLIITIFSSFKKINQLLISSAESFKRKKTSKEWAPQLGLKKIEY
jgi:hypothetical protein